MKARLKGTDEVFKEIKSVIYKSGFVADIKDLEFEQEQTQCPVDLSECSEEYRKAYYDGWNKRNLLQTPTSDDAHWQEVREKAAIAILQAMVTDKDFQRYSEQYKSEMAVKQADALVERLKGE